MGYCSTFFWSTLSLFRNEGYKIVPEIDFLSYPANVDFSQKLANNTKLMDSSGHSFRINADLDSLATVSPSCAVFFILARYLNVIIVTFMILFVAVQFFISYYLCSSAGEDDSGSLLLNAVGLIVRCTYYGGIFRSGNNKFYYLHYISYIGWIIASYFLIILFMYKLEMLAVKQKQHKTTASDYSLIFGKLPLSGVTQEDIQQVVDKISPSSHIVSISNVYEIFNSKKLKEQKSKIECELVKMENSQGSLKKIAQCKKNLEDITRKLNNLKNQVEEGKLYTGYTIATFETIEQRDSFYDIYQGSIFQRICRDIVFAATLTMVDTNYKKRAWKIKNKIFSLKRAPHPAEIIWENYCIDKTHGAKIKIFIYLSILIAILICMALAWVGYYFSYKYAVDLYFKQNSINLLSVDYVSTIFLTLYLIVINFFAKIILTKLCLLLKETELQSETAVIFFCQVTYFISTNIIIHFIVLNSAVNTFVKQSDNNQDVIGYIFVSRSLFFLSAQFIGDVLCDKISSLIQCILLRFYSKIFEKKLTQGETNLFFAVPEQTLVFSLSNFASIIIFISFYANITWVVSIIPFICVVIDYWIEKYFIFYVYQAPKRIPLALFALSFKTILIFNYVLSAITNFNLVSPMFGEYKIANIPLYAALLFIVVATTFIFHVFYSPQAILNRARLDKHLKKAGDYSFTTYTEAIPSNEQFSHLNPLNSILRNAEEMSKISERASMILTGNSNILVKPQPNFVQELVSMPPTEDGSSIEYLS